MVIHHGVTAGVTSVEDACREYENNNALDRLKNLTAAVTGLPADYSSTRGGAGTALITKVEVLDLNGTAIDAAEYGQSFILRYYLKIDEAIENGILRVAVDSEINKGIAIIDNYEVTSDFLAMPVGEHIFDIVVRDPALRPGVYTFSSAIVSRKIGVHIFFEHNHARLMINHPKNAFFYADYRASVQLDVEYMTAGRTTENNLEEKLAE